jgi:class 3 adenylate cyclase
MGKIVLKREIVSVKSGDKVEKIYLLKTAKLDTFNPSVLGLGDIRTPSKDLEAVAAIFDLSGFTKFCGQIDPQLCVPEYLSRFLEWLFEQVKKEFVNKSYPEGKTLYADLPFLAKFLGDGVLFLWDTKGMQITGVCNIVVALRIICMRYGSDFYPKVKKDVVDPPTTLRCGIARGKVFSVGSGDDYVGPCINIAARLQKLSLMTFCVSRKGFDFSKGMNASEYSLYTLKSVALRGIGDRELVWVFNTEFGALPEEESKVFKES